MSTTEAVSTERRCTPQSSSARTRRRASTPERSAGELVYVRSAVVGPWQLAIAVGCMALTYLQWSVFAVLVSCVLAEASMIGLVSRLPVFRRHVDARNARAAQLHAAGERAALLARMSEEHRHELAALETMFDRIRGAAETPGLAEGCVVEDCKQLLSVYVRLAMAYQTSRECLAMVDRAGLSEEYRTIEAAAATQVGASVDLARQRLTVLAMRIERWERTRDMLGVFKQRLALVADLLRLIHEQIAAPPDPEREATRIVVDGIVPGAEEVADLLRVEPTVDVEVLELGRAPAIHPA